MQTTASNKHKNQFSHIRQIRNGNGFTQRKNAFGQPYSGNLSGMMNLGYTGKPYDTATGLYSKNKPRCNKVTLINKVELCDAGAYSKNKPR